MIPFANAKAEQTVKAPCASIDTVFVSGSGNIGDTCVVTTRFKSAMSHLYRNRITFSKNLEPLGLADSISSISSMQVLTKNTVNEENYSFIVKDTATAMLGFSLEVANSNLFEMDQEEYKYVELVLGSNMRLWTESETNSEDLNIAVLNEVDFFPVGMHTFNISGKVCYRDEANSARNGAFNVVRLYFAEFGSTEEGWTGPISRLYLPNPPAFVNGIHYALCNDAGEYNFSFKADPIIMKNLKIFVVVEKQNFALNLFSPSNHIAINTISGGPCIRTFRQYKMLGFNPNINTHEYPNTDIEINPLDGHLFRYTTLSKMFLKARFDVGAYDQLPFNTSAVGDRIPQVIVNRIIPRSGYYRHFNQNIYLGNSLINPNEACISSLHEYGHYVDDAMNNMLGCGKSENTEAFAFFFTNSVLAWNDALYNEPLLLSNNLEVAQNYTLTRDGEPPLRGQNLSPIGWKVEGGFANYLWNLYDMKDEGIFTANRMVAQWTNTGFESYGTRGFNNDDLDYGRQVFDWWIEFPEKLFLDFHQIVLATETNPRKINSLNRMFDFDTLLQIDLSRSPAPAQYNSFDVTNGVINVVSGSYPAIVPACIEQPGNNGIFDYTVSWNVKNCEEGYMIANQTASIRYGTIPFYHLDFPKSMLSIPQEGACIAVPIRLISDPLNTGSWQIMSVDLSKIGFDFSDNCDFSLSAFPNPCLDIMNISMSLESDSYVEVRTFDIRGNLIESRKKVLYNSGKNVISINTNTYTKGSYNVVVYIHAISGNIFEKNISFIKQ